MMYHVILVLLLVKQGSCLRCFNCQKAIDGDACIKNQVASECDATLKQPACMSLSFKNERNKDSRVFGKTCIEYKTCAEYCKLPFMRRRKDCEATCCTGNKCNKNTFDKTVIVDDFGQKAKRSNTQLNKDSANKQDRLRTNELLLFSSIVTTIMLRYAVLNP